VHAINADGQALGGLVDADEDVGPDIICGGQRADPTDTDEQSDNSEIAHWDLPGPAFSPHLRLTMPYRGQVCKVSAMGAVRRAD